MRLFALRLHRQHRSRPTAASQRAGLDHLLRIAAEQAAAQRAALGAAAADYDPEVAERITEQLITLRMLDAHYG